MPTRKAAARARLECVARIYKASNRNAAAIAREFGVSKQRALQLVAKVEGAGFIVDRRKNRRSGPYVANAQRETLAEACDEAGIWRR